MYMTGFADEVSSNIDAQIEVTKALGWSNIEMRAVYNGNIAGISEADFEEMYGKLADAGVKINSYGSGIANWACHITNDPQGSYDELKNAIPRLHKLGTEMVRIMSFFVPPELRPNSWDLKDEVVKRLKVLTAMAEDAGLLLVHENCQNWGGLSYEHTLYLLEQIRSPAFKLVFDTGNPAIVQGFRTGDPEPYQNAWDFYRNVREHIAYVHIKDAYFDKEQNRNIFCYAGEGINEVPRILEDLVRTGYDGGYSIEPHMGAVFHDPNVQRPEDERREVYIEYGKRCEKMIRGFMTAKQ